MGPKSFGADASRRSDGRDDLFCSRIARREQCTSHNVDDAFCSVYSVFALRDLCVAFGIDSTNFARRCPVYIQLSSDQPRQDLVFAQTENRAHRDEALP